MVVSCCVFLCIRLYLSPLFSGQTDAAERSCLVTQTGLFVDRTFDGKPADGKDHANRNGSTGTTLHLSSHAGLLSFVEVCDGLQVKDRKGEVSECKPRLRTVSAGTH